MQNGIGVKLYLHKICDTSEFYLETMFHDFDTLDFVE